MRHHPVDGPETVAQRSSGPFSSSRYPLQMTQPACNLLYSDAASVRNRPAVLLLTCPIKRGTGIAIQVPCGNREGKDEGIEFALGGYSVPREAGRVWSAHLARCRTARVFHGTVYHFCE